MKYLFYILAFVVALDVFGFMMWILSGQQPLGEFYIGALTANVLKLFL